MNLALNLAINRLFRTDSAAFDFHEFQHAAMDRFRNRTFTFDNKLRKRLDSLALHFHVFMQRTMPCFNHLAPTRSNNNFKRLCSCHASHAALNLAFSIFIQTRRHRRFSFVFCLWCARCN